MESVLVNYFASRNQYRKSNWTDKSGGLSMLLKCSMNIDFSELYPARFSHNIPNDGNVYLTKSEMIDYVSKKYDNEDERQSAKAIVNNMFDSVYGLSENTTPFVPVPAHEYYKVME